MKKTKEGHELLRLLRGWRPITPSLRDRLSRYIESTLPLTKRRYRPTLNARELLALREWLNQSLEAERAKLGEAYDEAEALDKLVPAWNQSRRSLRVLISKKLAADKGRATKIIEAWESEPTR